MGPNFFGIADRLGMLKAGKLAEVIATPGDPPADIRQTKRIFFAAIMEKDYL